jgi:hypothetical protein
VTTGRYYTDAEFAAAVRRQADIDSRYRGQFRAAVQQQNRGWVYQLVRTAVNLVFGSTVGEFIGWGVDYVWDYFSGLFSG